MFWSCLPTGCTVNVTRFVFFSYALRKHLPVGLTFCEPYVSRIIPEGARPVLYEMNNTARKCAIQCVLNSLGVVRE